MRAGHRLAVPRWYLGDRSWRESMPVWSAIYLFKSADRMGTIRLNDELGVPRNSMDTFV